MTASTQKSSRRRCSRWPTLVVALALVAGFSGCHSTRGEQTRYLCRPICFSCDDYRRKCDPPVCVGPCRPRRGGPRPAPR